MALKYGEVTTGNSCIVGPFEVAASEVFKDLSGKYVKMDNNRRLALAGSGDTEIVGWALTGEITASSSAGQTKLCVDISTNKVWEIPADDTFTEAELQAMMFKTCDLIVSNNIQYADIGESNEDVIQIVGGNVERQTLYVRLNPNKICATGVA